MKSLAVALISLGHAALAQTGSDPAMRADVRGYRYRVERVGPGAGAIAVYQIGGREWVKFTESSGLSALEPYGRPCAGQLEWRIIAGDRTNRGRTINFALGEAAWNAMLHTARGTSQEKCAQSQAATFQAVMPNGDAIAAGTITPTMEINFTQQPPDPGEMIQLRGGRSIPASSVGPELGYLLGASDPNAPKKPAVRPAPSSRDLQTTALSNAADIQKIHDGRFDVIQRQHARFKWMFLAYVNNYGHSCPDTLPADKVEMTREICIKPTTTVRRGVVVDHGCAEYETQGSGVYADPRFYSLYPSVQAAAGSQERGNLLSNLANTSNTLSALRAMDAAKADMKELFQLNTCQNPGLGNFGENLFRLVKGEPPIINASPATAVQEVEAETPAQPQPRPTRRTRPARKR